MSAAIAIPAVPATDAELAAARAGEDVDAGTGAETTTVQVQDSSAAPGLSATVADEQLRTAAPAVALGGPAPELADAPEPEGSGLECAVPFGAGLVSTEDGETAMTLDAAVAAEAAAREELAAALAMCEAEEPTTQHVESEDAADQPKKMAPKPRERPAVAPRAASPRSPRPAPRQATCKRLGSAELEAAAVEAKRSEVRQMLERNRRFMERAALGRRPFVVATSERPAAGGTAAAPPADSGATSEPPADPTPKECSNRAATPKLGRSRTTTPKDNSSRAAMPKEAASRAATPKDGPSRASTPQGGWASPKPTRDASKSRQVAGTPKIPARTGSQSPTLRRPAGVPGHAGA